MASRVRPLRGVRPCHRSRRVQTCAGGGGLDVLRKMARVVQEKAAADASKLFSGAAKTRESLSVLDELLAYWSLEDADETLEEMEDVLLSADFGPNTATAVVERVREAVKAGGVKEAEELRSCLKETVVSLLAGVEEDKGGGEEDGNQRQTVVLVCGVNGAGKTTTLGKLAKRLGEGGAKRVLMIPGDTFRAAASEQLEVWAERAGATMSHPQGVAAGGVISPQEIVREGMDIALRDENEDGRGTADVVLCDTSGRLHTDWRLMDELIEVKAVIADKVPGAPHEVLMVLDGTTGLNMLAQVREFHEAVGLTGLVVTKLDGTARGGCIVAVAQELGIPVKFIGVGEGIDDLQIFNAEAFVDAIL